MTAGTREWLDTDEVRDDLENILAQLSPRQLSLIRRLSTPGQHPLSRTDLEDARGVNWITEGFWFRRPLLEVKPEGAVVAESARALVTDLLDARFSTSTV